MSFSQADSPIASDLQATSLPSSEGTPRYHELDALRGIAALSVVLAHFFGLWDQNQLSGSLRLLYLGPLQLLKAGHAAVQLFFVLSGFVLALPALSAKSQPYRIFLLRRLTRVYLPYVGALVLAVGCDAAFRHPLIIDEWFGRTWSKDIAARDVFAHLILFGLPRWSEYNTAFWSVIYELRVSLIFPFLLTAVLATVFWMRIVVLTLLFALNFFLAKPPDSHTIFAIPAFVIGITCAQHRHAIAHQVQALSRTSFRMVVAGALVAYAYGSYLAHLPRGFWLIAEPVTLAGATTLVLVAFSRSSTAMRLKHPILLWLGQISYSVYLVHGTILFALAYLCYGKIPTVTILPIYLVLVLLISRAFNGLVERPCMNLGRYLTSSKAGVKGKTQPWAA